MGAQMNRLQSLQTVEYYAAMKRHKLQIHAVTWLTLRYAEQKQPAAVLRESLGQAKLIVSWGQEWRLVAKCTEGASVDDGRFYILIAVAYTRIHICQKSFRSFLVSVNYVSINLILIILERKGEGKAFG